MICLRWCVVGIVLLLSWQCAAGLDPEHDTTEGLDADINQLLPGVWVGEGVVEFDATVAIDCHDPLTPDVYLEMFICGPDSREHESLLVTDVVPSNLHAGLLAAGITPGNPVSFAQHPETGKLVRIPAQGKGVYLDVRWGEDAVDADQDFDWKPLIDWVVHVESGESLSEEPAWKGFVFAGSTVSDDSIPGPKYGADREGSHVSLTAFGHEVISPIWILSPDAGIDEPVWIALRDRVPTIGTEVRVRISRVDDEHVSDEYPRKHRSLVDE